MFQGKYCNMKLLNHLKRLSVATAISALAAASATRASAAVAFLSGLDAAVLAPISTSAALITTAVAVLTAASPAALGRELGDAE